MGPNIPLLNDPFSLLIMAGLHTGSQQVKIGAMEAGENAVLEKCFEVSHAVVTFYSKKIF
jgi:hypothetical protein